jgi:hypothetical protein
MIPAEIAVTGNTDVDTTTAEIAVHLRNSGMTERAATAEAQRIRDTLLGAAVDAIGADRHATIPPNTTWFRGNQRAEQVVRRLTGSFGCLCTGFEGCPSPSSCGTPQGCHCGA